MGNILLSPPIAFLIVLAVMIAISQALTGLAPKRKASTGEEKEPYACGEDTYSPYVQPDYGQFFPFAFFFTILHVVALVITTVPKETIQTFAIALIYIACAIVGLFILFRKED